MSDAARRLSRGLHDRGTSTREQQHGIQSAWNRRQPAERSSSFRSLEDARTHSVSLAPAGGVNTFRSFDVVKRSCAPRPADHSEALAYTQLATRDRHSCLTAGSFYSEPRSLSSTSIPSLSTSRSSKNTCIQEKGLSARGSNATRFTTSHSSLVLAQSTSVASKLSSNSTIYRKQQQQQRKTLVTSCHKDSDIQWDPAVKEIVGRIAAIDVNSECVASRGDGKPSGFSNDVIRRGREGCSLCWKQKRKIVSKRATADACNDNKPHRPWKGILFWPGFTKEWVVIRPRPSGIYVHFRLCHYGSRCRRGQACTFAHSQEEKEAWTLDRDGVVWRCRQPGRLSLCHKFSRYLRCRDKDACAFAHGEDELDEWRERVRIFRERQRPKSADSSRPLRLRIAEEVQLVKQDPELVSRVIVTKLDQVKIVCHPDFCAYIESAGTVKRQQFTLDLSWPTEQSCRFVRAALLNRVPNFKFAITKPNATFQISSDKSEVAAVGREPRATAVVLTVIFESSSDGSFVQDIALDMGTKPYVVKTLSVEIGRSNYLKAMKEFQRSLMEPKVKWDYEEKDLCRIYLQKNPNDDIHPLPKCEDSITEQVRRTLQEPLSSSNYQAHFHTLITVEELARSALLDKYNRAQMPMKVVSNKEGAMLVEFDLGEIPPNNVTSAVRVRLRPGGTVYELKILTRSNNTLSVCLPSTIRKPFDSCADQTVYVDFQLVFDRTHFLNLHQSVSRVARKTAAERLVTKEIDVNRAVRIKHLYDMCLIEKDCRLNADQQRAIQLILSQRGTLPIIVNGPFGTGKTFLLAEAIRLILMSSKSECRRVLVCTHSNHAADLYVKKIHEFRENHGLDVFMQRVYYKEYAFHRIDSKICDVIERYCRRSSDQFLLPTKKELVGAGKLVVVTTLITSMQLSVLNLPKGFFTHVVIDEAAQATEAETVAPLGFADSDAVVVLAGDHKQINPVVNSDVARIGKLQRSLFRRLYKELVGKLGMTKVDLTTNYRCHYDILEITSKLFYGAERVHRTNACGPQDEHPVFKPVSFFASRNSRAVRSRDEDSYYNHNEAEEVVRLVKKILEKWPQEWQPYTEGDLCVITSEKNQANFIRRMFRKDDQLNVQVLTSAVVQGREFRACVISTVMTSEAYRERREDNGDFLSDAKLLNTAMTRAQSLVLVVGDPRCLCTTGKLATVWQNYVKFCNVRGTFDGCLTYNKLLQHRQLVNAPLNPKAVSFEPAALSRSSRLSSVAVATPTQSDSFVQSPEDDSDDDMVEMYRRRVAQGRKARERESAYRLSGELTILQVESVGGYIWEVGQRTTTNEKGRRSSSCPYEKHLKSNELALKAATDPQNFVRARLKVLGHEDAYGTVEGSKRRDIVLRGLKRRNRAFDGEEVLVRLDQPQSNRGTVVGIFNEERPLEWLCVLSNHGNGDCLLPLDSMLPKIMNMPHATGETGVAVFKRVFSHDKQKQINPIRLIPLEQTKNKIFVVQLLKWKVDCKWPMGIVVEEHDYGLNVDSATKLLALQYLPVSKSDGDLEAAANGTASIMRDRISREEYARRGEVITNAFTIDAEGADELDDALSLDRDDTQETFRVGIYISDVSHYVKPRSTIDRYAYDIGTSFYTHTGKRQKPMLPETISSNLCSLLPQRDRLVVALFVNFDIHGLRREGSEVIERRIIRSRRKLSYKEVERLLDMSDKKRDDLASDVSFLYEFSFRLRCKRMDKHRSRFFRSSQTSYHRAEALVEEFMILANQLVAQKLMTTSTCRKITPLLCQGTPDSAKTKEWVDANKCMLGASLTLSEIAGKTTFQTSPDTIVSFQKSYWKLFKEAAASLKGDDLKRRLLDLVFDEEQSPQLAMAHKGYYKTLQRKAYVCAGSRPKEALTHHELGSPYYTHFTSPMRRYIDLLTHRLLIGHVVEPVISLPAGINEEKYYSEEIVHRICCHCSRAVMQAIKFETESRLVDVACSAKAWSVEATAVVESVASDSLRLYFPDVSSLSGRAMVVRMSSLNAVNVELDEDRGSVTIEWAMRTVDCSGAASTNRFESTIHQQPAFQQVYVKLWHNLLELLESDIKGDDTFTSKVRTLFREMEANAQEFSTSEATSASEHTPLLNVQSTRAIACSTSATRITKVVRLPVGHMQRMWFDTGNERDDFTDDSDDESSSTFATSSAVSRTGAARMTSCIDETKSSGSSCMSVTINRGDIVSALLHSRLERGILKPIIQQLVFGSGSHICLTHYERPEECFAADLPRGHRASVDRQYPTLDDYVQSWMPVLAIESATCSVKDSSHMTVVKNLSILWKQDETGAISGHVSLNLMFVKNNNVAYQPGDYVCLRYDNLPVERNEAVAVAQSAAENPRKTYCWVAHCIVQRLVEDSLVVNFTGSDSDEIKVVLVLAGNSKDVPFRQVCVASLHPCTAQFIQQSMPYKRMMNSMVNLHEHQEVPKSICLGEYGKMKISSDSSYQCPSVEEQRRFSLAGRLPLLNAKQYLAVNASLTDDLTVIQGPPGTGKTVTGVRIAYINCKRLVVHKRQVMYCCPANQAVDDVAEKLKDVVDSSLLLRVYGEGIEKKRFPGLDIFRDNSTKRVAVVDDHRHNDIALHYRIRQADVRIRRAERKFRRMKAAGEFPSSYQRHHYELMVSAAEEQQIRNSSIILCTCSQAGSRRLIAHGNIELCIVDEAGQSTEPETLVAIAKAKRVVLIGDHKQLQPVVQSSRARDDLCRSMFERIIESREIKKNQRFIRLIEQHRMHFDICSFPSTKFYERSLETPNNVMKRHTKGDDFWYGVTGSREKRKCFVHVEGKEDVNAVASEGKGGEESKFNSLEAQIVVDVVKTLKSFKMGDTDIQVLTPYTAQRVQIQRLLSESNIRVTVSSIFASQGSEAEYIILSTVRSMPLCDVLELPSQKWKSDHLGFVTDEHQINVALTRAKQGLLIIGNSHLLSVHQMWRDLIATYKREKCFFRDPSYLPLHRIRQVKYKSFK